MSLPIPLIQVMQMFLEVKLFALVNVKLNWIWCGPLHPWELRCFCPWHESLVWTLMTTSTSFLCSLELLQLWIAWCLWLVLWNRNHQDWWLLNVVMDVVQTIVKNLPDWSHCHLDWVLELYLDQIALEPLGWSPLWIKVFSTQFLHQWASWWKERFFLFFSWLFVNSISRSFW